VVKHANSANVNDKNICAHIEGAKTHLGAKFTCSICMKDSASALATGCSGKIMLANNFKLWVTRAAAAAEAWSAVASKA
jgi:HD-like signal output (HDOD) protein